jgi:hypothetical protein
MLVYTELPENRTFRIIKPSARRTAKQNAARFMVARGGKDGFEGFVRDRLIDVHMCRYDGMDCVAINYFGGNPRPRVALAPAKVTVCAADTIAPGLRIALA